MKRKLILASIILIASAQAVMADDAGSAKRPNIERSIQSVSEVVPAKPENRQSALDLDAKRALEAYGILERNEIPEAAD